MPEITKGVTFDVSQVERKRTKEENKKKGIRSSTMEGKVVFDGKLRVRN